jgi:hypothetical protein
VGHWWEVFGPFGITRARKLVVLIGTKRARVIAVKNDNTESRFTQLAARLAAVAGL